MFRGLKINKCQHKKHVSVDVQPVTEPLKHLSFTINRYHGGFNLYLCGGGGLTCDCFASGQSQLLHLADFRCITEYTVQEK